MTRASTDGRLLSLDAYRGFVMLALVTGQPLLLGLTSGLAEIQPAFDTLAAQFHHVKWAGCAFWDLIAPAFALMVGAAIPYSHASRRGKGQTEIRIHLHTLYRSAVFILLGMLLYSDGEPSTRFEFTGLLVQFGLAYPFAAMLVGRGLTVQCLVAALILLGWWLAFALYPLPPEGFDYRSVGVPVDWDLFTGFFAHWNRGANLAADFDVWLLNLFPRDATYLFHKMGNQSLNFIPKIVTMIWGVMIGELLRGSRPQPEKLRRLALSGGALLATGLLAAVTICPMVKLLWTPSYVLFSGGCVILLMAGFFWVFDIRGWSKLAFPLVVVGTNSLAMYVMDHLLKPWATDTARTHLPESWTLHQIASIAALWLICFWMYRRKIFLRV